MKKTILEFSYPKNMANFEAFCWSISSSINFLFLKSDIFFSPANCPNFGIFSHCIWVLKRSSSPLSGKAQLVVVLYCSLLYQYRTLEIAHTKLPKWSLWDFIDVGGESKKIEKIFGRNGDNHLNDSSQHRVQK